MPTEAISEKSRLVNTPRRRLAWTWKRLISGRHEVVRGWRANGVACPSSMISARGQEEVQKASASRSQGSDDYITGSRLGASSSSSAFRGFATACRAFAWSDNSTTTSSRHRHRSRYGMAVDLVRRTPFTRTCGDRCTSRRRNTSAPSPSWKHARNGRQDPLHQPSRCKGPAPFRSKCKVSACIRPEAEAGSSLKPTPLNKAILLTELGASATSSLKLDEMAASWPSRAPGASRTVSDHPCVVKRAEATSL